MSRPLRGPSVNSDSRVMLHRGTTEVQRYVHAYRQCWRDEFHSGTASTRICLIGGERSGDELSVGMDVVLMWPAIVLRPRERGLAGGASRPASGCRDLTRILTRHRL